jgi:hypothetical protein
MADIRIEELFGERVVVHFGTGPDLFGINSYTFGQALLGLTATAIAVNNVVNPGEEIEIIIESDGRGSFRAALRRLTKGKAAGFFSEGAKNILWAIVATAIWEYGIKPPDKIEVHTSGDEIVIQRGTDRIIVPLKVHADAERAKKSADVRRNIVRTFTPLEANPAITDFGFTGSINDTHPIIRIPRDEFPMLLDQQVIDELPPEEWRQQTMTARILILKAWINHKKRKWSFEWNGVPVSAAIVDEEFLDRIDRREYLIGAGDALDVEITVMQHYDKKLGVYVNDPKRYLITRVIEVISKF